MRVACEKDAELSQTTHVRLEGQLDAPGSTHFWEIVGDRIVPDASSLLLDMRGVRYVSSAGVAILIRALTRVQQHDGALALYGCNSRVKKIFAIVNIEPLLNLRETDKEARARLSELGASYKTQVPPR